jgi:hypothetical protein
VTVNPHWLRIDLPEWRAIDGPNVDWKAVLRADPCAYCGKPGGTVDHIVPRPARPPARPGGWWNYTGACERCNVKKGRLPFLLFLASRANPHWWHRVPLAQRRALWQRPRAADVPQ